MIPWNYPKHIFIMLSTDDLWITSLRNFLILNIVYFAHNMIENRGEKAFADSISDQLFLLFYYLVVILLSMGLFKVLKIKWSASKVTQFLLSSSLIFSIIYIADLPVQLLKYNFDVYFRVFEFGFYAWVSWVITYTLASRPKRFAVFAAMMSIFYITSVVRAALLGILTIWT